MHPGAAGDAKGNGSGSGSEDWEGLLTAAGATGATSACSCAQWSQCQSQWQCAMSAPGQ